MRKLRKFKFPILFLVIRSVYAFILKSVGKVVLFTILTFQLLFKFHFLVHDPNLRNLILSVLLTCFKLKMYMTASATHPNGNRIATMLYKVSYLMELY